MIESDYSSRTENELTLEISKNLYYLCQKLADRSFLLRKAQDAAQLLKEVTISLRDSDLR